MVILSNAIWLQLGNTSFFSAVVPVAIGGLLAHFKPWLTTEDDVRNRVNQHRQVLLEAVCKSLHRVLSQVLTIPTPIQLRGQPPNEPDIIGDYVTETFRIFAVIRELELIQKSIKAHYTCLYFTAALGVVGFLTALPFEDTRPIIAIVCFIAILTQIYAVGVIRGMAKRLEIYERTT